MLKWNFSCAVFNVGEFDIGFFFQMRNQDDAVIVRIDEVCYNYCVVLAENKCAFFIKG